MIAPVEQGSSTRLPLFHCQYHQCSHLKALGAYSASESVELPGSLLPWPTDRTRRPICTRSELKSRPDYSIYSTSNYNVPWISLLLEIRKAVSGSGPQGYNSVAWNAEDVQGKISDDPVDYDEIYPQNTPRRFSHILYGSVRLLLCSNMRLPFGRWSDMTVLPTAHAYAVAFNPRFIPFSVTIWDQSGISVSEH